MVGAPSSRVQLAMKFRRSAGDQFTPAPRTVRVPKSESWLISAFAFSVRFPSALKSRPRWEIGRSMFPRARPTVRESDREDSRPVVVCEVSRWTVLPPTAKLRSEEHTSELQSRQYL